MKYHPGHQYGKAGIDNSPLYSWALLISGTFTFTFVKLLLFFKLSPFFKFSQFPQLLLSSVSKLSLSLLSKPVTVCQNFTLVNLSLPLSLQMFTFNSVNLSFPLSFQRFAFKQSVPNGSIQDAAQNSNLFLKKVEFKNLCSGGCCGTGIYKDVLRISTANSALLIAEFKDRPK